MDSILYHLVGWLLLGGGGLVLLFMLLQQIGFVIRSREVHRQEVSLLGEQVQRIRELRERQKALPASWNGTRKFRVDNKVPEGGGICSFYLTPHDGKVPLPEFLPGQFLTFQLEVKGKEVVRCYSLSDCHRPNYYRVSIKAVPPPRDKPGIAPGLVSNHFHSSVEIGDILDVKAPAGEFCIDPHEISGLVLNGAGVGLTPVLSMMNALMDTHSRREIWFFYGVRNGSENIIKEKVAEWKAMNLPNVHINVCYSDPAPEESQGRDFDYHSRVDPALMKKVLPSNNFDFFTCGPPPMMSGLREGLAMWGVPESRIHDEAFMQEKKSVSIAAAMVEFKRSGKKVEVAGEATTLVDLADLEGIRIPTGCGIGHCGTCQTALIEGKVKYASPPNFAVEDGCCLPCVCLPEGNIVLDV